MSPNIYFQIVEKIISEQENIIGLIAVEQATEVKGLEIDWKNRLISFNGNESEIIDNLVEKYREFFGQVSVQVCRQATRQLISQLPKNQQPTLLR
jgi:hypothetical protein